MNARRFVVIALLATAVAGLSACGSSGQEELQQWMKDQRNATKPSVAPLSAPSKFSPETYGQERLIEPFSIQKLTQALNRDSNKAAANAALIEPELRRRKEPLEASPLDAITMVGSLIKAGHPVALVRVDNLVYQVKPGEYLGQNYGRITKVTETGVTLREIVQDAAGEWIERAATLELSEGKK